MVADEAAIIVKRDNARIASEALAFHAAGASIVAGDNTALNDLVERLTGA